VYTGPRMENPPYDLACVTVAIPAYNEAPTIAAVIRAACAQSLVRELVVVDDGSSDGTWQAIAPLADADARIKALRHEANLGKGAALRTAFANATSPIVLVQDADREYDPSDYPALIAPIAQGRADIVYGSRFPDGRTYRGRQRWHAAGNRLLTRLFNFCANRELADVETGFKVFRRELLLGLELVENGFGFDPEISAKLLRDRSVRFCDVPIAYCPRSRAQGKKIGWRDGMTVLRCIVQYNLRPGTAPR
jgi:glycosyltransferase involved in cell wall biosynthesis